MEDRHPELVKSSVKLAIIIFIIIVLIAFSAYELWHGFVGSELVMCPTILASLVLLQCLMDHVELGEWRLAGKNAGFDLPGYVGF